MHRHCRQDLLRTLKTRRDRKRDRLFHGSPFHCPSSMQPTAEPLLSSKWTSPPRMQHVNGHMLIFLSYEQTLFFGFLFRGDVRFFLGPTCLQLSNQFVFRLWNLQIEQHRVRVYHFARQLTRETRIGAQRRRVNGSAAMLRCSCASRYERQSPIECESDDQLTTSADSTLFCVLFRLRRFISLQAGMRCSPIVRRVTYAITEMFSDRLRSNSEARSSVSSNFFFNSLSR